MPTTKGRRARTSATPGAKRYFDAIREIFELQSKILTSALPHNAERGRNDEERLRAFLDNTLPKRFSVGTGFVACSTGEMSKQSDVVIFDELYNSPLHRELAAYVFPVEMVYATIEVKGCMRTRDIADSVANLTSVRRLAQHKQYNVFVEEERPGEPGKLHAVKRTASYKLAPRAFVVAYEASGWSDVTSFAESWAKGLSASPAHIHGILVVSKGWFLTQVPYNNDDVELRIHSTDALLKFLDTLIANMHSMFMAPANMAPYFGLEARGLPNVSFPRQKAEDSPDPQSPAMV